MLAATARALTYHNDAASLVQPSAHLRVAGRNSSFVMNRRGRAPSNQRSRLRQLQNFLAPSLGVVAIGLVTALRLERRNFIVDRLRRSRVAAA